MASIMKIARISSRLPLWLMVVAVTMVAAAAYAAEGTPLLLTAEKRGGKVNILLDTLVKGFNETYRPKNISISRDDLRVGLFDLNGDGEGEVFVTYVSPSECTKPTSCTTGIYHHVNDGWRIIGEIMANDRGRGFMVWVEEDTRKGWRIIRQDDKIRYCWIDRKEPYWFDPPGHPFKTVPHMWSGYIWPVSGEEPCPPTERPLGGRKVYFKASRNATDIIRAFLIDVAKRVQEHTPYIDPPFEIHYLKYTTTDLNDDGKDELLVRFGSSMFCGNSAECPVSIYQRDEKDWRFLGEMSNYLDGQGYYIVVEDGKVGGWRTLHAETYRMCWSQARDIDIDNSDPPDGMKPSLGEMGYFNSVRMDEKCPNR